MKYKESENDYLERGDRDERRRRIRIATAVAPSGLAVILIFGGIFGLRYFFGDFYLLYNLFVISLLVISAMSTLMLYLQTGFKSRKGIGGPSPDAKARDDKELPVMRREVERLSLTLQSVTGEMHKDIERIHKEIESQRAVEKVLDEEQKNELVNSITKKINTEAADEVLAEIRGKIAAAERTDTLAHSIAETFEIIVSRLRDELAALTRRGNLNLVLGMITTAIGLAVLGYFVTKFGGEKNASLDTLLNFVPRLSLVVFIEVFAYFFLRLYKASLAETKYFQNELTNIESKAIALQTSIWHGETTVISNVIERLALTERNRVLEEGQTTVELEKSKIDKEAIASVFRDIAAAIKSRGLGGD